MLLTGSAWSVANKEKTPGLQLTPFRLSRIKFLTYCNK